MTGATDPPNGETAVNADNTITYTPDADFTGEDMFDYTVEDDHGASATAAVNVTVSPPPNGPPVALDDQASTFERIAVNIEVLANDSDPENETLTLVDVTTPGGGTAVINGGGSVVYTPNTGFDGVDNFSYTVSDTQAATSSASVRVTVLGDEIPPTITATVSPPPNARGWNRTDVTVTFDCQDDESGIESCSDPVEVTTEGAGQEITGIAVDLAGNSATTTVVINLR